MITIKTDKGLEEVEGWDQIAGRPGFLTSLDPTKHTLDSIVGRYAFKEKIPCGLSNCRTPHAKGYLVATKDGCETNIGKDCGKTYFGVDFETLSRQFDRDITASENRTALWNFRFLQEEHEAKLAGMRADGADRVYNQLQPLLHINRGCPVSVVRTVAAMVKRRDGDVMRDREATPAEIERMEAEQRRKIGRAYVTEVVAQVRGIEALYPENDLRTLMILDLESNFDQLRDADIDAMRPDELRHWSKWIGTVEATLERVAAVTSLGRALLVKANLAPLGIKLEADDLREFEAYLAKLSRATC